MGSARQRLEEFLFPPGSDTWLGVLRIGVALQVIIGCLSIRGDWLELFSLERSGLIKRDLAEAILSSQSRYVPRLSWLVELAAQFGVSEQSALTLAWWSLLCAAFLLLLGLFSREAAITTLFLHLCVVKSTGGLAYGVDNFTSIGLFYVTIAPLADRFAADRWLRSTPVRNACLQGFHRRILQLHLCLIYFFGGITKCAGAGWWDGTSIWRALIRPPFNLLPPETLIGWRNVFPVLSISVCLLETGYPVFIWPRRTRTFWLLAMITMHLAIGLAMGLYLFAFAMITLNFAAFGPEFGLGIRPISAPRVVAGPEAD